MPTTLPTGPTEQHLRVALGVERFALLPLRVPVLSIVIAAILAVVAILGYELGF